jgi:hypothetical protein
MLLYFFAIVLIYLAWLAWIEVNQSMSIEQARSKYPRVQPLDQQDSEKCNKIAKKLYLQMHGDKRCIERLFVNAYRRNPDKSELWVWEKIAADLDRDRRAY